MTTKGNDLAEDIDVITEEIIRLRGAVDEAIFQIGERLKHVRDNDLTRGQWYAWLKSVGYTPSTATRYIQVFEQFGEGANGIPVGKLFELLRLPDEVNRKEFLNSTHRVPSTGETKRVEEMTVKETREVVRERQGKLASPAKESTAHKAGGTPYLQGVITALGRLIPDVSAKIESGDISLEDAVYIGGELNPEQQAEFCRVLKLYGESDSFHELFETVVRYLRNGADQINIGQYFHLVQVFDELIQDYPEAETERHPIDRAIDGLENISGAEAMRVEILRIISEVGRIRSRLEQRRRDKERAAARGRTAYSFFFTEYLSIMGLNPGATYDDVKKAWRTLARKYHPDNRDTGDADMFMRVKDAYDILESAMKASA